MWILFKQFFKTFYKNGFLVFGLFALITTLSFLVSTAINTSQSFNNSLTNLNSSKNGKKAEVVSNQGSDFGYLDFSYDVSQNNEKIKVFSSSLDIQYDAEGNITRKANTIFPYDKDKLLSRNNSFGVANGITLHGEEIDPENMYSLNLEDPNGIWTYNYGLSVSPPISFGFNNKKALAWSFVESDGTVAFNPNDILFNSYGIPMFFFTKGTLNNDFSIPVTFDLFNESVFNEIPNIYDETGLGITNKFFERSQGKIEALHDHHNYDILNPNEFYLWNKGEAVVLDILSHFLEVKEVTPVIFKINLDQSSGPIKYFIENNPDIVEKAFNNVFFGNNVTREKIPGNFTDVDSNISIRKVDNNFEILLGVDDDVFVDWSSIKLDPNSSVPFDEQLNQQKSEQVVLNKKLYLNNFQNYISTNLTNEIKNVFLENFNTFLQSKNIDATLESEYYFNDVENDVDYLFVAKDNKYDNKVVVNDGTNLIQNDYASEIKKNLDYLIEGKLTTNYYIALNYLIQNSPDSIWPSRPNSEKVPDKITINSSDYWWVSLFKFSLAKVNDLMWSIGINKVIPNETFNDPYMQLLAYFMNVFFRVEFNSTNININYSFKYTFTTLHFQASANITLFDNFFCVLSNSYAIDNKKKYLPINTPDQNLEIWNSKIILDEASFTNWINEIKDSDLMLLSCDVIPLLFQSRENFFSIWLNALSDDYKIPYRNSFFLINGFGISPDYAYPIVSAISPIPQPENQAIVFLNESAYNYLDITEASKSNYYSYISDTLSNSKIISLVNQYVKDNLNSNNFIYLQDINNANNLGIVWLRNYFPYQINQLIVLFSVVSSILVVCLSLVVTFLLLKIFIKNLLEQISLCMGNGINLSKIILACLLNIGIVTTIGSMLGYIASYLCQNAFIGIFSSIWMVPGTIALPFTPIIFLPIVLISFIIFGIILSSIIYAKFKKPIPQIIANKDDIKANWFTNILRNSKLKIPNIIKLSIGYSSINVGRLSLLSVLGSVALGGIVSAVMINDKFNIAHDNTLYSKNYNYQYNFINVNESTGLYKPQKFSEMGIEDSTVGINSIYLTEDEWNLISSTTEKLPYFKEMFVLKEIPKGGSKQDLTVKLYDGQKRYLSNMVYPSWNTYNMIQNRNINIFFNAVASLFLLDLPISFLGQTINIWDFVKSNFPNWLVEQLESQSDIFQKYVMASYGEWYYDFIDNNSEKIELVDTNTNAYDISIDDIQLNQSGYYFARAERKVLGTTTTFTTKPYYVWVDSDQWYKASNDTINSRYELTSGDNITLVANPNSDFYKNNSNDPTALKDTDKVTWYYVPAYGIYHNISEKTAVKSGSDLYAVRYSDDFINFITTIYADEKISAEDSKISFGIIPFDEGLDEAFTNVSATITKLTDNLGYEYTKPEMNIDLWGINTNSDFIKLKQEGKLINNLLTSNNNPINIIINQGSSYYYGLDINDEFTVTINNNSLNNSFKVMQNLINVQNNPINTTFNFKVVGISDDAFGNKFYISQEDANKITGLDQMPVYSKVSPTIETITPSFTPFNGVLSKSEELNITYKSIPFYTYASIWTIDTLTSQLSSTNNASEIFNFLTSHNPSIIKVVAEYIHDHLDNNFAIVDNTNEQRNLIIDYINKNYSLSSIIQVLNNINQTDLLQSATNFILSSTTSEKMFGIVSNLSSTLIIIIASISIPLLILVTLVISLSIINDLYRYIGLMKVLGYSNRNIIVAFSSMYLPVLLITILVGLAISFALNYGVQFLVFNLTSIYLTPGIQAGAYFIGVAASIVIFILCIMFITGVIHRKGLENTIKF